MNLFDSKKKLGIAGVIMGLVAATLAYFGNPANMAICIACFVRDTAGALGLHSAEPVQYARPEIIGIVLGAFIISIATKEYRATAGSSTIVRFVLLLVVIGAAGVLKMIKATPGLFCESGNILLSDSGQKIEFPELNVSEEDVADGFYYQQLSEQEKQVYHL